MSSSPRITGAYWTLRAGGGIETVIYDDYGKLISHYAGDWKRGLSIRLGITMDPLDVVRLHNVREAPTVPGGQPSQSPHESNPEESNPELKRKCTSNIEDQEAKRPRNMCDQTTKKRPNEEGQDAEPRSSKQTRRFPHHLPMDIDS